MDIIFERNTAEINKPYKKNEKKEPRDFCRVSNPQNCKQL